MKTSLGSVTARLVQPSAEDLSSDLVDLINRNVHPPKPVSESDVYVAAMYVVSDEVNSFGGRFPVEEHGRLVQLLIDSPVLAGHRKDHLPIGRNFHAVTEERDGRSWVKSYFYWLKDTEGAHALSKNIDGGVYKECSIGFTFRFPECSECGKDIRTCPHEPLQSAVATGANQDDGRRTIYFNYRQIERVLETSLVYRGAVSDTSVSRQLVAGTRRKPGDSAGIKSVTDINQLSELVADQEYLLVPFYEALPVMVTLDGGVLHLERVDGGLLPESVGGRFGVSHLPPMCREYAHLVAYRGRERCTRWISWSGIWTAEGGRSRVLS